MIGSVAEQAVIGSVLLDSRSHRFADEVLQPEDFSALQFEILWSGITKMLAAGEPVDVITVSAKLGPWEVRGLTPADLHMLVSDTPSSARIGSYAEIVHADAMRRAIRVAGHHALQGADSSEFDPGEILARTINEFQEIQAGATKDDLNAKTLAEILAGVDEYDWVIPNLLERRDRLILTGGEGAGKSTFVRQLAITSAAGIHPMTFERIEPVRVLVIDAENSEKQWRRASKWLVTLAGRRGVVDPATAVNLVCAPRLDLTRDAHLGQVHRLVDRYQPDVLFIGPLYRLTPRAITNDDDASPLLAAIDTLRDRGLALVMEAHAGHAVGYGGERDLRPRGSAALMGWPEFGYGIRTDRDSASDPDPSRHMYNFVPWRGDRDKRDWPVRMRRGREGEFPWIPVHVEQ